MTIGGGAVKCSCDLTTTYGSTQLGTYRKSRGDSLSLKLQKSLLTQCFPLDETGCQTYFASGLGEVIPASEINIGFDESGTLSELLVTVSEIGSFVGGHPRKTQFFITLPARFIHLHQ
jgi:hypothetical protein